MADSELVYRVAMSGSASINTQKNLVSTDVNGTEGRLHLILNIENANVSISRGRMYARRSAFMTQSDEQKSMTFPKPNHPRKARKPMNKIGKAGKRRLAANKARKPLADEIGRCEVGPILKARGITFRNCLGDLTWAHSVKRRGNDPVLEEEVARCCTLHHFYVLDLLSPQRQKEIVCEAIRRRGGAIE